MTDATVGEPITPRRDEFRRGVFDCPECGHSLPLDGYTECDRCGAHLELRVHVIAPAIDSE